ncbi:hypothetical protein F4813DRAFT_191863 [Daldinia decipiens]|uniref:uncharacterized protein n=1 Tax=Daldinia decipiens TaxID=326647 RepID=UPI0020C2B1EE|nr:uncharacterized protein F4813DRAFT_191863 [Daldinia decipiens]KAI1654914.1 hypothetical protein F4813DRAFT_191863 [Daldinia decipiens]
MRLHLLILFIGSFISYIAASSAPTFCKCTCFKNSTLIQLGPQGDSSFGNPEHPASPQLQKRAASASCTQCTRAFCLSQHLPICKDAEETDVITTCFQRDSRKDQIIVWGFILGTISLLGWAAAKRVVEFREGRKAAALGLGGSGIGSRGGRASAQGRGAYMPVGNNDTQGLNR